MAAEQAPVQVERRACDNRDGRRIAMLPETSLSALVLVAPSGLVLFANQRACDLLEISRDDFVGSSVFRADWCVEAVDGGAFPPESLPVSLVLAERRPVRDVEFVVRSSAGRRLVLSVSAEPVLDDSGGIDCVAVSIQDVTRRHDAERELRLALRRAEEAVAAKDVFLATMSHEMRTPLHAVLGSLELLDGTELGQEQRGHVAQARRSARTLLDLLNDVIDLSRLHLDQVSLRPEEVVLDVFLDGLVGMLRGLNAEKGLSILLEIADDVPRRVLADVRCLRQILVNLLGNAIKFTDAGRISLRVERVTGPDRETGSVTLAFRIRDTGIGIPDDKIEDIFEAFRQVDGSDARRFAGTGLGLAISRRLARRLGGDITVSSRLGLGSEFVFSARFPLVTSGAAADEPGSVGSALIVAADPDEEKALASVARRAGFAARTWRGDAHVDTASADLAHADVVVLGASCPADRMSSVVTRFAAPHGGAVPRVLAVGPCLEPDGRTLARDGIEIIQAPLSPLDLAWTARPGKDEEPDGARETLAGCRALLVEDSPVNAKLAVAMLTRFGVEVSWVSSGAQGLEALERDGASFDAILTDIQMPEMDGLTFARIVRSRFGHLRLPMLALSANAFTEDRWRALNAGMDGGGMDAFLAKPFSAAELRDSLQGVLRAASAAGNRKGDLGYPSGPSGERLPSFGEKAPLDLEGALARLDGDAALFKLFVETALPYLRDSLAKLGPGADAMPAAELLREVHTIKGLAGQMGAVSLQAESARLQSILRSGVVPTAEEWEGYVATLKAALLAAEKALDMPFTEVFGRARRGG